MSDIKQKEHEAWWRGFRVGTECAIDTIKRHLKENPKMPLDDLIIRIKVSALTQSKGLADE